MPKLDNQITLDNIKSLSDLKDWHDVDFHDKLDEVKIISEEEANNAFDGDSYAQMRVLSQQAPDDGTEKDTLIIHLHGGGFIAMSSGMYQSITRVWAREMPRSVICSLDYRLAPGSRYPD